MDYIITQRDKDSLILNEFRFDNFLEAKEIFHNFMNDCLRMDNLYLVYIFPTLFKHNEIAKVKIVSKEDPDIFIYYSLEKEGYCNER